jgi:hypothetical protein
VRACSSSGREREEITHTWLSGIPHIFWGIVDWSDQTDRVGGSIWLARLGSGILDTWSRGVALVEEGEEEPRGARWFVAAYHQRPKQNKKQVVWQRIND